ncbi:MAG: chemotaxis protein CheX [Chloroflexi bacterium]|nr:chemotaxis protein CheX [Chloroflexota bacterium]
MNVKFLNPFVEAAYEVLQAEVAIEIARGELSLEKEAYVTNDVTAIISVVGLVEGTVFYGMDQRAAVSFASRMLSEPFEAFNHLAQSGIAELANVITGRATVKLSLSGYEATISPPTMLIGKGSTISTLDFARLVVPLQSSIGSIVIHLALREGARQLGLAAATMPVPARPSLMR